MNISQYVKTLLPSLETRELKYRLQTDLENVNGHLLPAVNSVSAVFDHKYAWKSKPVQNLEKELLQALKGGPMKLFADAGLLEVLKDIYTNMVQTLPYIREEVDKTFGREFTNIGLTFAKGNLIQYAEVADFAVYYSRVLINFITSYELMILQGRTRDENLPRGDEEYLIANATVFANAMKIMAYPVKDLKEQLRKVPDMVIDPETEESAKIMVGASNLDPMGFAALPFPISLIYHFGLARAESQVEDLEAIKAETKIVEYRCILLKQRIDGGNGDAAIEKELEIQEDRLFKLRKKKADWEAKHRV